MNKRISDKLIPEYRTAIRLMREGKFGQLLPVDLEDEIGKLGQDLNNLARELERRANEEIKIRKISEDVSSGMFLDDILGRAFDSFQSVIPYNRLGCALLNDKKNTATACWTKTDASTIRLKTGFTAAMVGSSLQQIIETGQPRILNDLEDYLAEHPASVSTALIVKEGIRSSLTCPLISGYEGKPVGFLFFSSNDKNTYNDIHQDCFLRIAGHISALIEKSRLYQKMYKLNQKLIGAQHELQYRATHDSLTGVYNRRAITEHLEAQLARAKRNNQALGIVMIDIDNFKQVNDTYGHLAGDAVIKMVAARMKKCLREYDYIGRYGGEEFMVVLSDVNHEVAAKTAERLNQVVGGEDFAFNAERLAITITISAGVVVVETHKEINQEKVIMAADQELYKAKSNGRNRVEVCRI